MTVLDIDGRGHRPLPEDRTALVVAAILLGEVGRRPLQPRMRACR